MFKTRSEWNPCSSANPDKSSDGQAGIDKRVMAAPHRAVTHGKNSAPCFCRSGVSAAGRRNAVVSQRHKSAFDACSILQPFGEGCELLNFYPTEEN